MASTALLSGQIMESAVTLLPTSVVCVQEDILEIGEPILFEQYGKVVKEAALHVHLIHNSFSDSGSGSGFVAIQ